MRALLKTMDALHTIFYFRSAPLCFLCLRRLLVWPRSWRAASLSLGKRKRAESFYSSSPYIFITLYHQKVLTQDSHVAAPFYWTNPIMVLLMIWYTQSSCVSWGYHSYRGLYFLFLINKIRPPPLPPFVMRNQSISLGIETLLFGA